MENAIASTHAEEPGNKSVRPLRRVLCGGRPASSKFHLEDLVELCRLDRDAEVLFYSPNFLRCRAGVRGDEAITALPLLSEDPRLLGRGAKQRASQTACEGGRCAWLQLQQGGIAVPHQGLCGQAAWRLPRTQWLELSAAASSSDMP